jgi:replicative DNA helicase
MKLFSLELEQSVIGSILIDPDTLPDIRASVPPESFYSGLERVAYTTIATMSENGSQIDFLTVSNELEKEHPGHDWLTYLATVAKNVPSTANVVTYAHGIRQYHYLRRLYQAGQEVSQAVLVDGSLSEKVAAAQKAVHRVLELEAGKGPQDSKTVLRQWLAHLETVHANDGVSGLSSGISDLDDMTHGMKPGELHILAARPGQGKTILALQIGYHCASRSLAVLIFSLEMQARELFSRLASCATGTYYRNLQTGDLDGLQWENITGFVEKASTMNLHIDDRPGLSIDEIRSVARAHRNKHGIHLVIVDYLQLASGTGESDVVRVGSVSKGLKEMAKELDCPVLALSQFNRGVEQRSDGRPKLSDLRSSGQIEQDADVVAMLHRIDDNCTELIVEKNRHGRTGSVWLQPVFDRMQFKPGLPPITLDEPPAKGKLRY